MNNRQVKTSAERILEHYHLNERIKKLEEKVFKNVKRKQVTKSQKLLLFKELGLLDKIDELKLSQNKRALLIATLIDADVDNVEKDLNQIHQKNSELANKSNYEFLVNFYKELKLVSHNKQAEKKYLEIQKSQLIAAKKK